QPGGEQGVLPLGGAVEAERAAEAIRAQRRRPEPFREPAGAEAAHDVHLEEAVLSMDEAQCERGVAVGRCGDGGNAVFVATDAHLAAETAERQAPVLLRQRRAQPEKAAEDDENRQEQQQTTLEESPHRPPPAPWLSPD